MMEAMAGLITEEQEMIGQAVRRFAQREYGVPTHRLAFDRGRLKRLGELGCLALAIPEAFGGIGSSVEAYVALSAIAPFLPPEPVVASGVHAAALVAAAATPAFASRWLPAIASGEIVASVADLEYSARYHRGHVATTATPTQDGYRLDGFKPIVAFGAQADLVVVSAVLEGELALFALRQGEGVLRNDVKRIDGLAAADVTFTAASVPAEDRLDAMAAGPALETAADFAIAAQLAEMVGLMDALNAATREYAASRKQFGIAIANFQALQHRMADMWIATEEARSLALAAAIACTGPAETRAITVSRAMLIACDAARLVANEAVQIHGGIGTTDELAVSHWYRRLAALRQELGDRNSHLARLAA